MSTRQAVTYGTFEIVYLVQRTDRSTLGISVLPDGSIVVVAPETVTLEAIASRVKRRARWILKQQKFFSQFSPRTPPRRFLAGETHLYLGRQYRLKIEPVGSQRVRMVRGFIQVDGVNPLDVETTERLVTSWYRERAVAKYVSRVAVVKNLFPDPERFQPASLRLQHMKSRWGSMSASGTLRLHPELIRAPLCAIDYVICHELCHLEVPNHGADFYDLQRQIMPDWEQRKARLERALA